MFFIQLALGLSVFLLLALILAIISRINILTHQMGRIQGVLDEAEKKIEGVAKNLETSE